MSKRILVLDDEIEITQIMAKKLTRVGYEPIEFANAPNAIEYLKENDADLVVSDMRMPDGLGITVLNYIKQHKRKIPVIFVTAYSEFHKSDLIKAGALAVFDKPINFPELLKLVESAIEPS